MLSFVSAEVAKPFVAVLLFALGIYILARFSFRRRKRPVRVRPICGKFVAPLGLGAGF